MRRFPTHYLRGFTLLTFTLLLSSVALSQSQSLGDIARENREKKAAQESSTTPPKVITNKNLPKDPAAATETEPGSEPTAPQSKTPFSEKTAGLPSTEQSSTDQRPIDQRPAESGSSQQRAARQRATELAEQRAAQQRANQQRAAAQWKKNILQQKATVANLRMRVDRLKASLRFSDPNYNGSSDYAGMSYNRYQARQREKLAQLQQQLDGQKRKLEDMQEAARHAGMHTLVYDP